jgi:hypothetical protein
MLICSILVFMSIVIQEATCAVASAEPQKHLQEAGQPTEEISFVRKRAALTKHPNDFNIQTRVLDASFNSITALKNNTLARTYPIALIVILNFSHNDISSIEVLAFNGLTHLQMLDLSHNKLTTLDPRTFIYTRPMETSHCEPNLENTTLDGNKHRNLNVDVFTEKLPEKQFSEKCNVSTTSSNRLVYLNILANSFNCNCHFYEMRKFFENINIIYELQLSCNIINGTCDDKEINQHHEIPSDRSEETTSVSINVSKYVTEATSIDDSGLRMQIIVINVLLCVFIFLTAVFLVLYLRQRRKCKRKHIVTSLTESQYRNADHEGEALKHYEEVGAVPSDWTPFGRPVMCNKL